MKQLLTPIVTLCVLLAIQANADIGLTAKVGTLGAGVDITAPIVPELLNARVGYNTFEWTYASHSGDTEGIDGTLHLETIPLLLDLHPARNNFRLTGGAVINNNSVSFAAKENGIIKIDDTAYSTTALDGGITFDDLGWYAGLGFGNAASKGRINFAFDLGVMFHGEPKAEMTATASDPSIQHALNQDLNDEMAQVNDDLKEFTFYPVLSFGISLRF